MIQLTNEPIDVARVLTAVSTAAAGAVVLFLGTTRQSTGGRQTISLDYEGYSFMAERKLHQLVAEASNRWPLTACAVVHRLGHLLPGETSVAVAVSAPHRKAAFAAGEWLIDTLKQTVPIWKRENWADGECDWIHPTSEDAASTDAPACCDTLAIQFPSGA